MWHERKHYILFIFLAEGQYIELLSLFQQHCFQACYVFQKPTFKVIEESRWKNGNKKKGCYYLFELNHKDVCSPKPASKLGGGAIFIIM